MGLSDEVKYTAIVLFVSTFLFLSFSLSRYGRSVRLVRSDTGKKTGYKAITYRLRGIPRDIDQHGVAELVRIALRLSASVTVNIRSLGDDPSEPDEKIATLEFSEPPSDLSKTTEKSQWHFNIRADELKGRKEISLIFDIHFRGFTPLHTTCDTNCTTDLIAISGLASHAFGSFKERQGPYMWLRDSLARDLPKLRILIYGYDTQLQQSHSFANLDDLANRFEEAICMIRNYSTAKRGLQYASPERPLILLGHSLGGLIAKAALIRMSKGDESHQANLRSICGLLFFGVPNQGMATSQWIPMVNDGPNRFFIEQLGKSSDILRVHNDEFQRIFTFEDSKVYSFYETLQSPTAERKGDGTWVMSGPPTILVETSSATHGRHWETGGHYIKPMNRTHSDLVRFSPHDEDYRTVRFYLTEFVGNGCDVIGKRFSSTGMVNKLSDEHNACLRSLAFPEIDARSDELRPQKNTCTWLDEHTSYKVWRSQQRGFLWINGKPGAGKSTLMKHAISKAINRDAGRNCVIASFFIHGRGGLLQKTSLGLYRSVLHQILPHFAGQLSKLASIAQKKEQQHGPGCWNWRDGELYDFLTETVIAVAGNTPIVLYIDALDECETATTTLMHNLRQLMDACTEQKLQFKICISSRHYPIPPFSNDGLSISVENENKEDVMEYIDHHLRTQFTPEELEHGMIEMIREEMLRRANGAFLWVHLVLTRVLRLLSVGEGLDTVRRKIQEIPGTLEDLYKGLLVDLSVEHRPQAVKLFQWICFASRPLNINELRDAMALDAGIRVASISEYRSADNYAKTTEQMERRLKAISCGLAETKGEGRMVQFIHESVKDFLLCSGFKKCLDLDDAAISSHFQISRCCIRYLAMSESDDWRFDDVSQLLSSLPLLKYSANEWAHHALKVELTGRVQDDLLELFHWPSQNVLREWVLIMEVMGDTIWPYPPFPCQGMNLLHILAGYGFYNTLQFILDDHNARISETDGHGHNPIHVAILQGQHVALKVLLQSGEGRFMKITEKLFMMAAGSTKKGAGEVMKVLLHEITPDISFTEEVAIAAAGNNETGQELIELLLLHEKGLEVSVTEALLIAAVSNTQGGQGIMQFLLQERGSEIIFTKEVIMKAVKYGNADLMQILLKERGPDIAITVELIVEAAKYGSKEMMKVLLEEKGSDISVTEDVLIAAAENSTFGPDVMGVLIEEKKSRIVLTKAVVSTAIEHWGRFSMSARHRVETKDMLRYILQREECGIKITIQMMMSAARNEWGGPCLMEALLQIEGTNILITQSTIEAAASCWAYGGDQFRALLRARPFDVVVPKKVAVSAARNPDGGLTMMEVLLQELKPDIILTEDVIIAAAKNYISGTRIIEFLFKERSEIQVTEAILMAAAEYGNEKMLSILLQHRQSEIKSTDGVLMAAAKNYIWGAQVTRVLLQGIDTEINITEELLLAAAKSFSGSEIMRLFLERDEREILISKAVIMTAIANGSSGAKLLKLFIQECGLEIPVTQSVLVATAKYGGDEMMKSLSKKRAIAITDEMVLAMVENKWSGAGIMKVLLQEKGSKALITEAVLVTAIKNWQGHIEQNPPCDELQILEHMLDESEVEITEEMFMAAAMNESEGPQIMKILLKRVVSNCFLTEAVIAAAGSCWKEDTGIEIMETLLRQSRGGYRLTEKMAISIMKSGRSEFVKLLFQETESKIRITEAMLIAAVSNEWGGPEIMKLLLPEIGSEMLITEKVLIAAVRNEGAGPDMMDVLLRHKRSEILVTESVIMAAVKNKFSGARVLEVLLRIESSNITITEDMVVAAAKNEFSGAKIVGVLFHMMGSNIPVTEAVFVAAKNNLARGAEIMEILQSEIQDTDIANAYQYHN